VNDDRLLDDEILDVDPDPDNTRIGKITRVEGGKLEGEKGDQKKGRKRNRTAGNIHLISR
jgi:hypothetical protein